MFFTLIFKGTVFATSIANVMRNQAVRNASFPENFAYVLNE